MTPPACCAGPPATVLRWNRAFPGRPDQAAAVRRFVAVLLPDCPFLDDVLLVADELIVNTIRHTRSGLPGGEFAVEVRRGTDDLHVAVTDQGGVTDPATGNADGLAECGRGLRTV